MPTFNAINPYGAYREARMQNEDRQAQSEKNRLAELYSQRQDSRAEQNQQFNQNRLTQQDAAEADQLRQSQATAAEQQQLKQTYSAVQRVLAAPAGQKKQMALAAIGPEGIAKFAQQGIDVANMDEDGIHALAQQVEAGIGSRLGITPGDTFEQVTGPRGSIIKKNTRTGDLSQVVGPDNTETRPTAGYRMLTPAEIEAAGLPAGSAAQMDTATRKVDVISKRDNTGVLSQKDATTAKIKLNTVSLARQQLNKIKEAFEEGRKGVNAFGGAQGLLPTQAGKKFDARVNQMRSTLTALTRVPGVGAMSDYETKLDQSKFPSRTAYESVTADTIQNLDDQLSLIENGYKSLLSGGSDAAQPPSAPPSAPAGPKPTVSNW